MSHVVSIATRIRDMQALRKACERLNWYLDEGRKTYTWFGRWIDDSPIPEHLFTPDEAARIKAMSRLDRIKVMNKVLGKCEHAIHIPGISYEIGLIQTTDGLMPIWDWYDPQLGNVMGQTGGPLLQAYAVEKAKLEATIRGYTCSEQTLEDSTIKLEIVDSFQ